jgi:hypothetical protein
VTLSGAGLSYPLDAWHVANPGRNCDRGPAWGGFGAGPCGFLVFSWGATSDENLAQEEEAIALQQQYRRSQEWCGRQKSLSQNPKELIWFDVINVVWADWKVGLVPVRRNEGRRKFEDRANDAVVWIRWTRPS